MERTKNITTEPIFAVSELRQPHKESIYCVWMGASLEEITRLHRYASTPTKAFVGLKKINLPYDEVFRRIAFDGKDEMSRFSGLVEYFRYAETGQSVGIAVSLYESERKLFSEEEVDKEKSMLQGTLLRIAGGLGNFKRKWL